MVKSDSVPAATTFTMNKAARLLLPRAVAMSVSPSHISLKLVNPVGLDLPPNAQLSMQVDKNIRILFATHPANLDAGTLALVVSTLTYQNGKG